MDKNCWVCRLMRAMALSGLGAGVGGYSALALGVERSDAILIAVFSGLALVVWTSRKRG